MKALDIYSVTLALVLPLLGMPAYHSWLLTTTDHSPVANSVCPADILTLHPKNRQYEKVLKDYQTANSLPGAIIAIKKGDDPLWMGAVGKSHVDQGVAMQVCTPFRIGSITKAFVAAAVLKLKEEGKLTLEDKLTDHLPELKGHIPQASQISIRMLLNHTSGLVDPKNDDPIYKRDITHHPEQIDSMSIDDKLQKYVYGKPLLFDPGSQSHYSNTGYWLLGKVIERIMQQPMQQVLNDLIFEPIKLEDTYYEERSNEKVAKGYFIIEGNLAEVTKWDKADGDGDPSSGIISTAADLTTFGEALFSGKLISQQSLKEMLVTTTFPSCPNSDCEFGLGIESWNVGKFKGYGKNGSSIGFEANLIYFPEQKTTFIIFTNKGGGSHKGFLKRMLKQS